MGKFEFTPMMTRYFLKFAFRIAIFFGVLGLYLFSDVSLWDLANQPLMYGVTPMHVLWVTFMVIMLSHIFPGTFRTMALKKADKETYKKKDGYKFFQIMLFVPQILSAVVMSRVYVFFAGDGVGDIGKLFPDKVL